LTLTGVALGDLIYVANNEHDQLVRLEIFLCYALHLVSSDCTDAVTVSRPIVNRALRILVAREDAGDLSRGSEVSRENFDGRILGRLELLRRNFRSAHPVDLFHDDVDRLRRRRVLRLESRAEDTRVIHAQPKVGTRAVGQTFIRTHARHNPRCETTTTKDVVHDRERVRVRVISQRPGVPYTH